MLKHLPEFISSAISRCNTSVGNNKAFKDMCVSLTSQLLTDRYNQVIKNVKDTFGYIPTVDEARSSLSRLVVETMKIEQPLRNQLAALCESVVNQTLGVPQETILLDCVLVDSIDTEMEIRVQPDFDSITPVNPDFAVGDEILKRRLIDSLVQGISYLLMTATYDVSNIKEWSQELPNLYKKIIALNDFLLFTEKEEINEKHLMLGAFVETNINQSDEKTVISAQGLVYPLLLQETYRGFFEAFAAHGLPDDSKEAMFVIKRADFLEAEPWDIRLGVPMWQYIDKMIPDGIEPNMYPYIFSALVQEDTEDFNTTIFDCLTHVEGRLEWFKEIVNQIKHDREYQLFKKDVEKFNIEKCLVIEDNI